MLTRFSLYKDMKVVTSHERVDGSERVVCDEYRSNNTCKRSHNEYDYVDTYGPFASWQGCVEARPYPYNVDDTRGLRRSEQHGHRRSAIRPPCSCRCSPRTSRVTIGS